MFLKKSMTSVGGSSSRIMFTISLFDWRSWIIHALKIILCILGILAPFGKSDEIQDNTSKITFKDITTTKWHNEDKTAKFTDVMATVANDYCSKNYAKCSLKFWNTSRVFKNPHIKMSPGYPKQVNNDLQISFYITLPSGTDIRKNSTTVLPKAAVATILQTKGSMISAKVGVEVKSDEDSTTTPKVDNRLNYIMIPVSFGLLLFVMVLALCLHHCQKQKIEETKKAERRQYTSQQKAGSSIPPSPFVASPIPEVNVKPQQRHDPGIEINKGTPRPIMPPTTTAIPENIVRPQPRLATNVKEAEMDVDTSQQNDYIITKTQSPSARKKKRSHKKKKQREENSHIEGGEDQEEEQESDLDKLHSKHRRKKKKRHKRKEDSAIQQDEENDTDREEDGTGVTELDISSRLPAPRKLPPLKLTADDDDDDGGP